MNPNYEECYYFRGLAYGVIRENSLACKDLTKSAQLGNAEADTAKFKYCK
ncbi:MAG: hypothetical protein ABI861_10960 [Panacibacter sp.]